MRMNKGYMNVTKHTQRLFFALLAFGIAFALVAVERSRAAVQVDLLIIDEVTFIQCGSASIEGSWRISAYNTDGALVNGTSPITATEYYTSNNGSVPPVVASYLSGQVWPFYVTIPPAPISYIEFYAVSTDNPSVRTDTVRIDCDGTISNLGGGTASGYQAPDDRLNLGAGDLLNVIYARRDTAQRPVLHVYSLSSQSTGVFEGAFAYEALAPYLSDAPDENTLIGKIDATALYALTTGEFQIVIGPDREEKTYSIILTGLPPKRIYYLN